MKGYGGGHVTTLGTTDFTLSIDEVEANTSAYVVPDSVQEVPFLIGRNFTELPEVTIIKDYMTKIS